MYGMAAKVCAVGVEQSEKKQGWFKRLKAGFSKSSGCLQDNLTRLWPQSASVQDVRDALEEVLIESNFGPHFTDAFLDRLTRKQMKSVEPEEARTLLAQHITQTLEPLCRPLASPASVQGPFVCVLCGVNGSGKTTTAGKMAADWVAQGFKVLSVGADLFRAAAYEQSEAWALRAGADFIGGSDFKDSGALAYQAYEKAVQEHYDAVLIDTAGRLHTQKNLMDELAKVVRVLRKKNPDVPHETLLVLDGTVGQNALTQTKAFGAAVPLTGLVLTKLDGTARAGIVVQVAEEHRVPLVALGMGEKAADVMPADAHFLGRSLVGLDQEA